MGKMGMWCRVQCGAGGGFPDVADEEGKVCVGDFFPDLEPLRISNSLVGRVESSGTVEDSQRFDYFCLI